MMRNAAAFRYRQFGSADVEVAVNLERIAIYHLAVELLGDLECEFTLT
jgi:hypothetical protein